MYTHSNFLIKDESTEFLVLATSSRKKDVTKTLHVTMSLKPLLKQGAKVITVIQSNSSKISFKTRCYIFPFGEK